MRRRRIRIVVASVTRTPLQRASCAVLAFCLVNALWSIIGSWSISFGGVSYHYFDSASRQSGIYSRRGYLVIALRQSSFFGAGIRPSDWQTRKPTRQTIPWSISADMSISPQMFTWHRGNGIIDDGPRTIFPGLLVNWQNQSMRGEWYNRGIAVHWVLLSALTGVVPAFALVRHGRRVRDRHCSVCAYDLRATPDRCPECGTIPANGPPHNPPMQRTGPAGELLVVHGPTGCRPGR